jgi:putative transposase
MARLPRIFLVEEGSTNHCVWRSHNLSYVLDTDAARDKFLALLSRYKEQHGVAIHSYCLMSTHPHVVCTATRGQAAWSAFWKVVNQSFARWYNLRSGRKGQVVMQRLRSPRIRRGRHLLTVMRYGDLNPVRAGMVRSAGDWAWSSYRHYALGEPNALVDAPAPYLALGRTGPARRKAYRALFGAPLSASLHRRHPEFVQSSFIGDEPWVRAQLLRVENALRSGTG